MRQILTICLLLSFGTMLFAQNNPAPGALTIRQDDPPKSYAPMVSKGEFLGNIQPLRELSPSSVPSFGGGHKLAKKSNYFFSNKTNNPDALPRDGDPLAKNNPATNREGGPEIIPGLNIEGLRDGGVSPPDPTGDIGKNHYLQMVNASHPTNDLGIGAWMQAWDKKTGETVLGPILSSEIWAQVDTGSLGDPIVQYDHEAERWIIMELQGYFTTELLLAISDDSDPTGSWKAYRFQTVGFCDYPKLYVWNNAYFITANEMPGNQCSGYALERSAILAGEPTFDIYRFLMPNYQAIGYQPATGADWEGGPPPPAGSPGYIFRVYDDSWDGGQDHLQIWSVKVDWNDQSQSSITGPDKVFPTPFETTVCYGSLFDCIEQPDGAPRITALESIIMYRAPYRNFGNYESIVLNHVSDVSGTVGVGGDAAVRWYELRKQGNAPWQIFQEGTYAPDLTTNRFMGTICTDEAGNIGLGYSGASESVYPGLYLTGRRATDPLGQMPIEEYTLAAGEKSHTGDSRWGDYSNLSVDPEDGRTFWYTGEYQPGDANWGTRVGSFKIQRDTYDLKPTELLSPVTSAALGNGELVKTRIFNNGVSEAAGFSVSLFLDGNLVATESIPDVLQSGASLDYTFAATVDLPTINKSYKIRIVTNWAKDQFTRNDTLSVTVKKLTSNDVAAVGIYNLSGQICGTETDFGIIIQNASGVPMQSAKVHWRINNQAYTIYNWTGNLAPGQRDSIDFHAMGIQNGLNGLRIYTSMPNGVQDERTSNDSIAPIKFIGNLDGTYLLAEANTASGSLVWQLRSQTDILLSFGEMGAGNSTTQICSDDNTCYKLVLKASTFSWQGHFKLYDIYGNVLVEATDLNQDPQVFNICTPVRKQVDVGAFALVSPVSGAGLTATEPVRVQIRNFGLNPQSNIEVSYRMNGGAWRTETFPAVLTAGATAEHLFSTTEDLSLTGGIYTFELKGTVAGDQQTNNDTVQAVVKNRALRELAVTNVRTQQACNDVNFAVVVVTVKNNGLGTDHDFTAKVVLNGVPQPNAQNTLSIPPDASAEIFIPVQNLLIGSNTVTVDLTNVDGQGEDEQPNNDTGVITFDINPNGFPVQLFFSTNDAPQETSWDLRDDQNNLVRAGGPYPDPFVTYLEELCLEKDKCYVFRLLDSGNNGMDGGFVTLFSPLGSSFWSYTGGDFGSQVSSTFCATELCANFSLGANFTNPSNNTASDGVITGVPNGGTAPFQFALNFGALQSDPNFTNLPNGVYNLDCLDANGCVASTSVELNGTISTHEPAQSRSLKVSPNPTKGMANIELPALDGEQAYVCEVLDVKGKLVQSTRLVRWDDTLRGLVVLDKLPSGLYIIRVKGLEHPLSAKLIKE